MTREESIILNLWTEFAIEEEEDSEFRCMGKLWHHYIGALQAAEKYLKEHNLIDDQGLPKSEWAFEDKPVAGIDCDKPVDWKIL